MAFGKVHPGEGAQVVGFCAVAGIAVFLGAVAEIAQVVDGEGQRKNNANTLATGYFFCLILRR